MRKTNYEEWIGNYKKCDSDFQAYVKEKVIRKIEGKYFVKRYVEKAEHNLDFANFVSDMHENIIKERFGSKTFYDWAIIAYYYAIYHAALALLAKINLGSKNHFATLCSIIRHYFYKNKRLEERHIKILQQIARSDIEKFIEAKNLRERASYSASTAFEKGLAQIAKSDAIEFVNKVKEIL